MDYRNLLKRYLAIVREAEGTDFLEMADAEIEFSEEEMKEMQKLSNE